MKLKTPSRAASTLTLAMVLLVATTIFAQQLSTPKSNDEITAKLVCEMVKRYHISQSSIDDPISAKLLQRLVKQLDGQKLYFTQNDIDLLEKSKSELDDQLKAGNVEFAYTTFDLFSKRVEERVALAQQLIDAKHDFTVDETIEVNGDDRAWAKTDEEVRERWRKQIKFDILSLKVEETAEAEIRDRLHKRYNNVLRTIQQTENHEKLELYLSALTHCFDPHSSYMSPETLEDFQIQMRLSLEGIGAALRAEDGYTVVASIVPGGAADKDGRLKKDDKIIGVDSGDGSMVDIVEMKLSKVVRLIRGKEGTKVRLKVKTADQVITPANGDTEAVIKKGEVQIYELTRQTIELNSAEVKGEIIETGKRLNGTQARVGVIKIPSFYRDFGGAQQGLDNFKSTARDVQKVLDDFRKKGVDAVIVDLRNNGGGALSEAIEVSGLFIDQGPVVQIKESNGKVKPHEDVEPGVAYAGPLVVVCNRLSASASEIFAGVIKDYRRGIVVGDVSTHGKGTVQNVMPVNRQLFQFLKPENRGALKLTINQFYRVNGDSTQSKGVESDVVLPSLLDHLDLGEEFLDDALPFDHVTPARYTAVGMVSPEMVSTLRQGSQTRLAADEKFREIQADIERYVARKNRKTVSLNEATLRKERLEEKKDKKENKLEELQNETDNNDGPIFPEDHYNNELLHITADYLGLLKGLKTAKN